MRLPDRRLAVASLSLLAVTALVGCADQARPGETGPPPAPVASPAPATSQPPVPTQTAAMGPVGADGCFDRAANGVAVRELNLYQSVRVPLIADGAPIRSTDRAVDVVADKEASIGIDVEAEPGWAAREVAVRVAMVQASGGPTLRSTRIVPNDDTPDPASLGDVVVEFPRAAVTPESRVSVTVVECTAVADADAAGSAPPASMAVDLAARPTGGIEIHLIPFRVGGFVPSTSADVLDGYREALLATYPVTDVAITVGDLVDGGEPPDLGALLVKVGRIRDQDRPAKDVYYYGMVTGAATRETYCDDCITGTSEDGAGLGVGFAIGAAFGDQKAEDTFLHELGHAHRLLHTPCGDVDDPNTDFPYPDGVIGVLGYDRRTGMSVPASTHDFMGYCFPRWISDYNYQRLVDRVAAVNGHGAGR